jgi:hypothetical protein
LGVGEGSWNIYLHGKLWVLIALVETNIIGFNYEFMNEKIR